MAGKQAANLGKHGAECHGRAPNEDAAGVGGSGQGRGLVLRGDGGQHGGLPPADAAVVELHPDGNVPDAVEPGGGDGEGAGEGDVEGPPLSAADVDSQGLLEALEPERHRHGRLRPSGGGVGAAENEELPVRDSRGMRTGRRLVAVFGGDE